MNTALWWVVIARPCIMLLIVDVVEIAAPTNKQYYVKQQQR